MVETKKLKCPLMKEECWGNDCALFYGESFYGSPECSIKSLPELANNLSSIGQELNNIKNKLGKIIEK